MVTTRPLASGPPPSANFQSLSRFGSVEDSMRMSAIFMGCPLLEILLVKLLRPLGGRFRNLGPQEVLRHAVVARHDALQMLGRRHLAAGREIVLAGERRLPILG